jgi:hypothetical protein
MSMSIRMQSRWGIHIAIAMVMIPALLSAQDREVLTISLGGGGDRAMGAEVLLSTGASRTSVARVTGASPLNLAMAAVNIGKGQRVAVNVTGDKVVLIPEGVVDTDCARATRREDQCRPVGVVTWGEPAAIDLTWKSGLLAGGDLSMHRFRLGADYAFATFNRLDDVACNSAIPGLTGCDSDNKGSGPGLYAEYALLDRLSFGARYSRSGYEVAQQYGGAMRNHDVNVTMIDFYGRGEFPMGTVRPWGMMGMSWFDNEDEIDDDEIRSESGLRLLIGGGIDLDLHNRFALRAGLRYASGGDDDADTHWGATFGFNFNF